MITGLARCKQGVLVCWQHSRPTRCCKSEAAEHMSQVSKQLCPSMAEVSDSLFDSTLQLLCQWLPDACCNIELEVYQTHFNIYSSHVFGKLGVVPATDDNFCSSLLQHQYTRRVCRLVPVVTCMHRLVTAQVAP